MGRLSSPAIRRVSIAAAAALILGFAPPLAAQSPQAGPASVADLAEGLLDAVVNISTSQTVTGGRGMPAPQLPEGSPFEEFFDEFFNRQGNGDRPQRVQSLGSGFVLDPSGIVITNNHVIEGADEIAVNFNDGSRLIAEVVGRDSKTDLAVLRVNPDRPLTALKFGDSDKLRVGDWLMAIGNPFGLGGTVTVGILSARNRDINSGPYDDFLQTDAAINRGNSGGPLFNMAGEVVGINTAIISPTGGSIGIGFAVPSQIAVHVIEQLREFGVTRRGWLGVRIQQVTDDIAEGLAMGPARGALVAGITDQSPAAEVGIKPGDVILEFAGKPIRAMRDLPRLVADTPVGEEVEVKLLRDGKEETLRVKVAQLDEGEVVTAAREPASKDDTPAADASRLDALGLKLGELTTSLRQQFGIEADVNGVVVTDVVGASPASEKGLEAGDVIVEIAQQEVSTPEEVDKRIAELQTQNRRTALLLVSDKTGELRFVAIRLP